MNLSPEEDTANLKPAVSAAIFTKNTNFRFITKIHTGLIEADDDNAINLALDAGLGALSLSTQA